MQFFSPKHFDTVKFADAPFDAARPLRIALLGYRSHPHVGGQGIYLKYLSRALYRAGHQVDILSGPPYPEVDEGVRLIKIPSLDLYSVFPNHIRAFRTDFLRSWSDLFEWFSMATGGFPEPYTFGRRVSQFLVGQQHYDVIHDNQSLGFGLLTLQHYGIPVVTTIHHPITQDRYWALQNEPRLGHRLLIKRWYHFLKMQQYVSQRLKHIVTVSEVSKNDICQDFRCSPERISVIPNGVDSQCFKPIENIAVKPLRILTTTSSDQALKGFATLLHALKVVHEQHPTVHLRVIGKLKESGSNQQLIKALSLENHISFRNQLTDKELCEEYAKAQLVVCPSLYEGFGLPAIEAMACGKPLISSDGGALKEVVGDGGVLFRAGDHQALAQQLLILLQDRERVAHLAKRGRARVLNHYCWDKVAARYIQYYRDNVISKH